MKEIGGYFELELQGREEFHQKALKLNSGRNCFKYILKTQKITKVYIPNYICDSIIEPLEEFNIKYDFYNIDERFEVIGEIEVKENEKFLYVNYYALKTKYINQLSDQYNTKLVIDNTQAFFNLPIENIDTIYSPRKFFGVSDGGYLYINKISDKMYEKDISDSYSQLLGRIELGASKCYEEYQQSECSLVNSPIKSMSNLTAKILNSIDYENVERIRIKNFNFLHKKLKKFNKLKIDLSDIKVPFTYPYMVDDIELRENLIKNKVYVAKYWNEVLDRESVNHYEKDFVDQIIPLPIDQRYNLEDMKRIVEVIKGCR